MTAQQLPARTTGVWLGAGIEAQVAALEENIRGLAEATSDERLRFDPLKVSL
jgi:hypothetical protein